MALLSVKNWAEFQHYKDRDPPWIKLHKKLLDDFKFHKLPLASRALAPMLWLVASESRDGTITYDVEQLAFRLHCEEEELQEAIKPLIEKGFLILERGASEPLADCERGAAPETEAQDQEEEESSVAAREPVSPETQVIQAFDAERVKVFGASLARSYPHNTDHVWAKRFLADGASLDLCRGVFAAGFQRAASRKTGPPDTLSFFEKPVANAIAEQNRPAQPGTPRKPDAARSSPQAAQYAGFAIALDRIEQSEIDRGAHCDPPRALLDAPGYPRIAVSRGG